MPSGNWAAARAVRPGEAEGRAADGMRILVEDNEMNQQVGELLSAGEG